MIRESLWQKNLPRRPSPGHLPLLPSSSMNSTKFPAQATARNLIQQHAREFGAVANVEGEGLSRRVDPRLLPQLMLDQREGGDEPRAGVGLR